jgi:Fe-S-cluster containining protein
VKRLSRRGWYKPAGEKVNKLLDDFELSLARIHTSFLSNMAPVLKEHGQAITCQPGCTHCCKCAFICTFLEGLSIARFLLAFKSPDWQGMWQELREHELRQRELGAPGWFELEIDCLFLREGRCTIYPVRPLNCRTHYAVSDPELCKPPRGDFEGPQQPAQILNTEAVMDLRTELVKGYTMRLLGKDTFLVATLPGAVNLGFHALTTDDYEMEGQKLEGEDLESFKKSWQDTSSDVVRESEEQERAKRDER